jgi:hypothetical protein
MRFLFLAATFAALSLPALADTDSISAPVFKVGDSWVFDQTTEKGPAGFTQQRNDTAIERLNDSTMIVGVKRDGAPTAFEDHVVGADWSQRRVVEGEETVTTRPLTFPMSIGKSWTIDFTDNTLRGAQTFAHIHRTYKVVGWEDVTVPAGTFHALKIVADGLDKASIQVARSAVSGTVVGPGGATSIAHAQAGGQSALTRRTYSETYYVPEVKNWVKMIEEQYNTDDVRTQRITTVLVSYKPNKD